MKIVTGIAGALLGLLVLGIAAGVALVAYYSHSLPSTRDLREHYDPPQATRVFAADGKLIGEIFIERRSVVELAAVPPFVVNAFVAAEDADFFTHEGLDYPGILRALLVNIAKGERSQGASTITQQVARTFYLGREKTFKRKVKELLLARRIEQNLSKEEILFLYLNQIYFGHGRYGVQEAARFYTGKDISGVSIPEAALLAGLPKGPELYSPFKDAARAKERRAWVLRQMLEHGLLAEKEAEAAAAEPLPIGPHESADQSIGSEFIDYALRVLEEAVGKEKLFKGGYRVYTTMSLELQEAAREAVRAGLRKIDGRRGFKGPAGFSKAKSGDHKEAKCPWYPPAVELAETGSPVQGKIYAAEVVDSDDAAGALLVRAGARTGIVDLGQPGAARYNPDHLPASTFARQGCFLRVSLVEGEGRFKGKPAALYRLEMGPEAAFVAIDVETARVVAMAGGYAFRKGEFNRALRSRRQPGSAFKTIVYLAALKARAVTPATMVEDTPLVYADYQPKNYEEWSSAEGKVRLRTALARSINLVALRVAEMTGIGKVVETARALGIESELEPNMALALGAAGVTPVELAGAYATIARGGMRWKPAIVTKILDPQGQEVPLPPPPPPERVIGPDEAYVVTSMLASVVTEGTAKDAMGLKAPCAGKTGTSNEAKDAWFVGFTPQLVAAAWVGFDDFKSLGKNETGAKAALPIWLGFMKKAVKPATARRFDMPPDGSVVVAAIDPATGLLAREGQADAISEVFLKGTEPTDAAPPPEGEEDAEEGGEDAEEGGEDAAAGAAAEQSAPGEPDASSSPPAPEPAAPRPRETAAPTPPPPGQ